MHILQPKYSKLKTDEAEELLEKFNISRGQLPKIKKADAALQDDVELGDIIKIERKGEKDKLLYYRVVVA